MNECGHPDRPHKARGMCAPCYHQSPGAVAQKRTYAQTDRGREVARASQAKYNRSDKSRDRNERWLSSEAGQASRLAAQRRYASSDRGRQKRLLSAMSPERAAARRAYVAEWTREHITLERRRVYHARHKYGLSSAVHLTLLASPCAVCSGDATDIHHRGRFVIAPLCKGCNTAETVLWREWRRGGIAIAETSRWADLITSDASRWPATRIVGYVLDRVPEKFWGDDSDLEPSKGNAA